METSTIDNLPEEVLEFILSLISPYKDLHDCMIVSKKWRRCVQNVIKTKQRNLFRAISEFDVKWDRLTPVDMAPTISKRYSHSAVIHDNSMYIFGGCTCSLTTFNDLWRLDLSKRQWIRPLAMGTYPSPKACCSLVKYKDFLVLFGGCTSPPSYPLYQSWHLFNELHVYDINGNRWTCINTLNTPPPVAGHSASVINEWMIIFGGFQRPPNGLHCEKSNDIWKLNLETWTWYKQDVENGPKPTVRFGQTQVILNAKNVLIWGGSGGQNFCYSDAWILNMEGILWRWIKVEIIGKSYEPTSTWPNPGCKVGDKLIVLSRVQVPESSSIAYYPKSSWNVGNQDGRAARIDLASRKNDRDENINGRHGVLRNKKREMEENGIPAAANMQNLVIHGLPSSSGLNMAAFNTPPEPRRPLDVNQRRDRRLGNLVKFQEQFQKTLHNRETKKMQYLGIYVLDLSQIYESKPKATWLPAKNLNNGPEETILYSLVEGKSELIMFGGIQKDANSVVLSTNNSFNSQISNSLHFITAPNYVI